jgi:hypothetical protein
MRKKNNHHDPCPCPNVNILAAAAMVRLPESPGAVWLCAPVMYSTRTLPLPSHHPTKPRITNESESILGSFFFFIRITYKYIYILEYDNSDGNPTGFESSTAPETYANRKHGHSHSMEIPPLPSKRLPCRYACKCT